MVQELILIGSGGCMRELLWQIEELNREEMTWEVLGYVDTQPCIKDGASVIRIGDISCPYLGDDSYLLSRQQDTNVAISVGEPWLRKNLAQKYRANPRLKFPNLILGDTRISPDVRMGQGCMVSMGCRISTNVVLGDFVFLNISSLVCHDGKIGDFTTLSPDVKAAGQVVIGEQCEIGLGSNMIQGITIGNRVIVGAGSVIVKDIGSNCTIAGVPAKRIK